MLSGSISRVSDSVGLWWRLRIRISNKFPSDVDGYWSGDHLSLEPLINYVHVPPTPRLNKYSHFAVFALHLVSFMRNELF